MNANIRRAVTWRSPRRATGLALGLVLAAAGAQPASAAHLETLYRFHGAPDGRFANSAPIVGGHGELYGTTASGGDTSCSESGGSGTDGCGIVYRLTPPARPGGKWTEEVLHRFHGGREDGAGPVGVSAGGPGVLYGATGGAGDSRCLCGTVFKLVH